MRAAIFFVGTAILDFKDALSEIDKLAVGALFLIFFFMDFIEFAGAPDRKMKNK